VALVEEVRSVMFNYDKRADALAIVLRDTVGVRTDELEPGTLVDVDEHGNVVAIEVIRPARAWPLPQILDSYRIDQRDADVLHTLWGNSKAYPFVEPAQTGAVATTSGDLIPA
jgi:uncharacterized protein YuzE